MLTNERIGDWMPTATGGRFWPFDPRASEVRIEDVAHQLSLIGRFGGTCREFYSVAQHSVLVSRHCPPESALWGLLHDAHEAYLGVDIPRPIKRQIPFWKEIEARIQAAICERFGLSPEMPAAVRQADEVLLVTEARDLATLETDIRTWYLPVEPLDTYVFAWPPEMAERLFLARFQELTGDAA